MRMARNPTAAIFTKNVAVLTSKRGPSASPADTMRPKARSKHFLACARRFTYSGARYGIAARVCSNIQQSDARTETMSHWTGAVLPHSRYAFKCRKAATSKALLAGACQGSCR